MSLLTQGADQFTGTGTYVRGLLGEFAQRPGDIRLVALCNARAHEAFRDCAAPNVTLARATDQRLDSGGARRAAALAGARLWPRPLARQFSSDAQVVHYPLTLGVPRARLPTVVSLHDVQHHDLREHFSPAVRLWRRIFYDLPARDATLVITLSEHSKSRIVDTVGVEPDRVVVIPLAADRARFRPESAARDDELLRNLDLPDRFVFYPATLWPHKNHLRLVDAFARVPIEDLHLLLSGAPAGRLEEVMAAARSRGIADRVRHLGFVADDALPALYRRATALVFPSTYEGFGAPTLEAMASGCPVASSMSGPLAEICAGATAVLDPDDPQQMADAIVAVVTDAEVRSRLRAAGLQRAQRFSWAESARAHVAAYRRAIETGS